MYTIARMKATVLLALLIVTGVACRGKYESADRAVSDLEHALTTELVAGDVTAATDVLADDFVLVDPGGGTWTKKDYLDAISAGSLDYLSWTIESEMRVLVDGDIAVLRYRATIDVSLDGEHVPKGNFWKSAVYQKRAGRWLAVWSQATQIS